MKFITMVLVSAIGLLVGVSAAVLSQPQTPQEGTPVTKQTTGQESPPENRPVVDVPVVTPIKPKEPQVDVQFMTDQATLPFNLVKNKLENLTIGMVCYVAPNAIKVDAKRKCWLYPLALTGTKTVDRPIQIKRDTSGYHVILSSVDHQWVAEDLNTAAGALIPVRSIAME